MKNIAAAHSRLLLTGLAALLATAPAALAQYSFTLIADSTNPAFSSFGLSPSINSTGMVAFHARFDSQNDGIYTGAGGPTTAIALSGEAFSYLGKPSINDASTVGFWAQLNGGGNGIYTSAGGATTAIAVNGIFGSNPTINASGKVAFQGNFNAGSNGVFTGTGGTTTTLATANGGHPFTGHQ